MLERAFNGFSAKLKRERHHISQLDGVKSSLTNEVSKLKKQLDQEYLQKAKVFRTHEELTTKCEESRLNMEKEQVDFIASEVELQELRQMKHRLDQDHEKMDEDLKTMSIELEKLKRISEEVTKTDKNLRNHILRLSLSKRQLDYDNDRIQADLHGKQEEKAELEASICEMQETFGLSFDRRNNILN